MKQSKERASMTRALVYYARLRGEEQSRSPLDMYNAIRGACIGKDMLAAELWAVQECLIMLDVLGEQETLKALKEIYLEPFSKAPLRIPAKSEISMRVLRFAFENHLDERTVYRRLQRARKLWLDILSRAI